METTKFICDCGHPAGDSEISTGYGRDNNGKTFCYECCAEMDREYLRKNGVLSGYFTTDKDGKNWFSNWPGSFKLPVNDTLKSWHNFAGKNGRTDFWLWFEGKRYHGVQIGHNNECATIRILKNQPK